MKVVLSIDQTGALPHQALIGHLRDLMQRVAPLVNEEAREMEQTLQVCLLESPLNRLVLKHDIVLDLFL